MDIPSPYSKPMTQRLTKRARQPKTPRNGPPRSADLKQEDRRLLETAEEIRVGVGRRSLEFSKLTSKQKQV